MPGGMSLGPLSARIERDAAALTAKCSEWGQMDSIRLGWWRHGKDGFAAFFGPFLLTLLTYLVLTYLLTYSLTHLLAYSLTHLGKKGAAIAGANNCPKKELAARNVILDDLLLLIEHAMPLSPEELECIRLGNVVCGAQLPPT